MRIQYAMMNLEVCDLQSPCCGRGRQAQQTAMYSMDTTTFRLSRPPSCRDVFKIHGLMPFYLMKRAKFEMKCSYRKCAAGMPITAVMHAAEAFRNNITASIANVHYT
jgi:hypothetical protein